MGLHEETLIQGEEVGDETPSRRAAARRMQDGQERQGGRGAGREEEGPQREEQTSL